MIEQKSLYGRKFSIRILEDIEVSEIFDTSFLLLEILSLFLQGDLFIFSRCKMEDKKSVEDFIKAIKY